MILAIFRHRRQDVAQHGGRDSSLLIFFSPGSKAPAGISILYFWTKSILFECWRELISFSCSQIRDLDKYLLGSVQQRTSPL